MAFEPLELIDRLAALVPPPRFHMVRYHGVLASRSKYRAQVVPKVTEPAGRVPRRRTAASSAPASAPPDSSPTARKSVLPRSSHPSRYYSWSELMQRVFEIDVLECPSCKAGPMRILAAIHPPTTTRAILKSLGLPTRAPPVTPAQPVPQDWSLAEASHRYRARRVDRPAA